MNKLTQVFLLLLILDWPVRLTKGTLTTRRNCVVEEKRQHLPSESKWQIVERHVGVQIEAHPNRINITKAIFTVPSQTLDIKLTRVIFEDVRNR